MESLDVWQTGLSMFAIAGSMAGFLSWGMMEAAQIKWQK